MDLAKELNYKLDDDGIDLLTKTLIYAPNQRITAKQMLQHRWFDEVREEMVGIFGNVFPHCGSPEYQRQRQQSKQRTEERKEDEEDDEDEDYFESEGDEDQDDDADVEEDGNADPDDEDDDDDMAHNAKGSNPWRKARRG